MLITTQIKSLRQYFYPCLGGILGGISVSTHFWLIFMPISLFTLWKGSERRIANFCWGFFFILISHSWLYDLHPLTWLGFSWLASLIIAILILLFCAFLGGILVYLWGLLVEMILWKEDIFKMKILSLTVKVFFFSLTWGIGELILSQTPFFLDRFRRKSYPRWYLSCWFSKMDWCKWCMRITNIDWILDFLYSR